METSQLVVPQERAEELYQECRQALKDHTKAQKNQMYEDLRKLYNQLRRKKRIIELFESLKKAGLNKDGEPKLAIAPANQKYTYFTKRKNGAGVFKINTSKNRWENLKDYVAVPEKTFADWPVDPQRTWRFIRNDIQTLVPLVPPKILLMIPKSHTLKNYDILFEVEKWELVPPRDPILVKQVTPNLYAVIATWDLTKLERAVMQGRI